MQIDEKALVQEVRDWLREPDWAETWTFSEWLKRRPVQQIEKLTLAYEAAKPAPVSEAVAWIDASALPLPKDTRDTSHMAVVHASQRDGFGGRRIPLYTKPPENCTVSPAPADPRQQVEGVKPLEWSQFDYTPLRKGLEAQTEVGIWRVFHFDEGWSWWRGRNSRSAYLLLETEAKAAAQADYEARICSALIHAPATAPAPAEMVEADGDRMKRALERIQGLADSGFDPPEGVATRIEWIEAELADEPNRPLYGSGEEEPRRNGHEIAELIVEHAGLVARAALAAPASAKVEAPGHTDLMVAPEGLDAFMEANPLPEEPPLTIGQTGKTAEGVEVVVVPREITPAMAVAGEAAIEETMDYSRDTESSWPVESPMEWAGAAYIAMTSPEALGE